MVACSTVAIPTARTAKGGTVTFAEAVGGNPNYIFPLLGAADFNVANAYDLVGLMYPELYAFGRGKEPVLSESLSLAHYPVFSHNNTVVTINLKHWAWSDGQRLTARDVIFWMNLLSAVTDPSAPAIGSSSAPGPGWGAEVPGGFPNNVVSYTASGEYSVVLHLNASYNPTWYLYNELSQIYPMPQQVWDELSAAGPVGNYDASAESRILAPASDDLPANSYVPANPGTATTGALGVAQFLNLQAQDLSTYATNPLWRVVDGPFKLTDFTVNGYVKLVPNKSYSGSPKPTVSAFEELPFTTDAAEFDALRTGSLTIGYIPTEDLAQKGSLEKSGYRFNAWDDFAISYMPYNFTNATSGPIFSQLYFRQAFQSLVNQPQYIKDFADGIGSIDNGPVPGTPPGNPDESPLEAKGQVYPYDPTKTVALLKDNGWKVVPGGVSYCSKPGSSSGDCGTGIHAHQDLTFKLLYSSGIASLANEMEALQSTAKSVAGIVLNLSEAPGAQVEATSYAGCTQAHPCNDWDITSVNFYFSWVYGPDYFPTGEELFSTGASANQGDYSSPTDNANIQATNTAPNSSAEIKALFKYEDYLARQLPVIWMPNEYYQLTMYKDDLKGAVPQSILDFIYPQFYSFKK
jgi:peptide/nickel transport system substrate-binding protein